MDSPDRPIAVQDTYALTRWLIQRVGKFPRSHRFVMGDRIEGAALDVLVTLTEAAYTKQKVPLLDAANRRVSVLRCLLQNNPTLS